MRMRKRSVVVIQPIDVLEDGRQKMCDGCPDMTVHEGRLAWSCRLEEVRNFGCFVNCTPKRAASKLVHPETLIRAEHS